MVQMLAQAAFFSLFARLFDSPDQERFLLIGNAVAVGAVGNGLDDPVDPPGIGGRAPTPFL